MLRGVVIAPAAGGEVANASHGRYTSWVGVGSVLNVEIYTVQYGIPECLRPTKLCTCSTCSLAARPLVGAPAVMPNREVLYFTAMVIN